MTDKIIAQIKSDPQYQKDPLTYIAYMTCELLNDCIRFDDLNILEEIAALIAFGNMLLNSSLKNIIFEDPKEISKVYDVIHEEYERSECRLRQAYGCI